jgi:hypothetical protein
LHSRFELNVTGDPYQRSPVSPGTGLAIPGAGETQKEIEMKLCKTVGELKAALNEIPDDLPIGISYSEEDGPGETLVVVNADHTKDEFWIGLDFITTDHLNEETDEFAREQALMDLAVKLAYEG